MQSADCAMLWEAMSTQQNPHDEHGLDVKMLEQLLSDFGI